MFCIRILSTNAHSVLKSLKIRIARGMRATILCLFNNVHRQLGQFENQFFSFETSEMHGASTQTATLCPPEFKFSLA